jgi:hypothetical protein
MALAMVVLAAAWNGGAKQVLMGEIRIAFTTFGQLCPNVWDQRERV